MSFLGYSIGFKGSVLLDIHSRAIHISRHVQFYEHILPYPSNPLSITTTWNYFSFDTWTTSNSTHVASPTPHLPIIDPEPSYIDSPSPTSPISPPIIRKSTRTTNPPSHLQDYVCNNTSTSLPALSVNVKYPISDSLSYTNVSSSHCAYSLSIDSHIEPTTYDEASKHTCWQQAMQAELTALENTGTWKLVDLPPYIKPIGCRWIYKVKDHADGTIERYKARLVAKGYNQIDGLDCFNTYSPVAKLTTIRTVIALASINNWNIHQLDLNNAFLHGDLQEDVYMTVRQGVTTTKPNQVCKLMKSLYGLK